MARYTIEMFNIMRDKNFDLFDFDYDFYSDNMSLRNNFEKKFQEHYMFNEIGAETVERFKLMLRNKLNYIMPKYAQLYITVKRVEDIDFMLNKDYNETITRELLSNSTLDANSINDLVSNTISNSTDNGKESNLNNGLSTVSMNDLTGLMENKNTSDLKDNSTNNLNQNSENNLNTRETITNSGQGNIGITSAGSLLKDWRDCIIDIDRQIIDDCYDLFMLVF